METEHEKAALALNVAFADFAKLAVPVLRGLTVGLPPTDKTLERARKLGEKVDTAHLEYQRTLGLS